MVKTDIKLLNSSINFLDLSMEHFNNDNKDTELKRSIYLKMSMAKQLLESAENDIKIHQNELIIFK